MTRAYLDWNATAPLRPEVREAMIAAMDVAGNPSSVHAEGRAARALVEKSRAKISAAFGADGADIVFTSGATEATALAMGWRAPSGAAGDRQVLASAVEHDCIESHAGDAPRLPVDGDGLVQMPDMARYTHKGNIVAIQSANSETGVLQPTDQLWRDLKAVDPDGTLCLTDATQSFGKMPFAFNWCGADMAIISAHKLGGPKGIGALVMKRGTDLAARITGGGQEMGRRSGTENVIGIAGFAAAAEAAQRDLETGVWERVAAIRNILENALVASRNETIFVGNGAAQMPNTSCIATPGWKAETQVMQMDLAGFAISAGSACSSGKVRASRVLGAMGYDDATAASAIRVSLGPETEEDDVLRFADAWCAQRKKHFARVA
ncbi:cysteine desulfurase family protein [Chachezhania antarctica]|uniref:cysteine desulfurase family protein n=1 Tax=Chachezhania antarctica TaxID=2340860 RepID=UPI000EAE0E3B|nr:cysteine desulfurase family protein [Chachezhania antarctica]|tara:strand:+ start:3803 stop:4936 length:1134 start_codon:yes stop_codon:yes gene_type:complete